MSCGRKKRELWFYWEIIQVSYFVLPWEKDEPYLFVQFWEENTETKIRFAFTAAVLPQKGTNASFCSFFVERNRGRIREGKSNFFFWGGEPPLVGGRGLSQFMIVDLRQTERGGRAEICMEWMGTDFRFFWGKSGVGERRDFFSSSFFLAGIIKKFLSAHNDPKSA